MANNMVVLQRKVDELFTELANYESEKANLEVAKQAGMARGGANVRLTKLKGLIRGAKLRLSNAEKKLNDASALRSQPLPAASGSGEPNPMGSEVSETGPMIIDNAMVNPPPNLLASAPGREGTAAFDLTAQSSNIELPIMDLILNASPQDAIPSIDALVDNPQSALLNPGFTVSPDSDTIRALQTLPPVLNEVSEQRSTVSFKRIDRSESENEEESSPEPAMNLITPEDKVRLQQQLFKRRFAKGPPLSKKVKYMEVSDNSDAAGDPNIFYDDDDAVVQTGVTEQTGPTGSAQPGNINLTVAVQPKPVPPANATHVSKESITVATSKGKDQERKTKGQKLKGTTTSKGKDAMKDPEDGKRPTKSKKKQDAGNKDTDEGGNDKEDYHASEHSVAKAARLNSELQKRRERLADPEGHRKFAEAWLNASSAAERPGNPAGIHLIRYDPDYLPDVATANYHLAMQLLFNNCNNYICIPHINLDRKLVSNVDNLQGPVQIWGTPLLRTQNPSSKTNIARVVDHFHCGCHEKVALAGFVIWKTWKARSMINSQLVVEGLHQHKTFSPREVLFILQFLKSKFGYTVEDMFTGSFDEEEELRKEAAVMKKVANFCARRHYDLIGQKMTLDDNFSEIHEEELKMEWI